MEGLENYLRYCRNTQYPDLPDVITSKNVNLPSRNLRRHASAYEPPTRTVLELVAISSHAPIGVPWLLSLGAAVTWDGLYHCKYVPVLKMMLEADPGSVHLGQKMDVHLLRSYWAVTNFEWFKTVVDAGFDVRRVQEWELKCWDAQRIRYFKNKG